MSGTLVPGGSVGAWLIKRHLDNGDSQLLVKLGGDQGALAGTWTLEVKGVEVKTDGTVHAWLGRGGGSDSTFDDEFASPDMTLTAPATAHSVITVAAVAAADGALAPFSSRGPTRDARNKPEIAAPGAGVLAARAGTTDQTCAMDGTSMAAPHVSGAIALVFSRAAALGRPLPAANQIRAALTQKAEGYNGHFEPGQGYGILDVAALLAAF